ncbi:Protein sel-1 -like protein 3 [Triplophysa tibetana]|uniref:Protein sel-1-like protein 3 n=1 Tax=Triplophysa tibetana TaxID=1572043 RepID=A0A5A9NCC5_9TELE|nr:Protein sel-1 -like protein 3 [Triplophysa tibetana]
MKVVWSLMCAVTLASVWCEEHAADRPHQEDFVQFGRVPDRVTDRSTVQVQFKCSAACKIGVEIVLSTPTRTGVIIYRRTWTNRKWFGQPRSRKVLLVFPPAVLYQRDFFIRRTVEARDVMVRSWLVHLSKKDIAEGYNQSLLMTLTFLRTLPASERPARPQTHSVSWGAWLMWQISKDAVKKCPHESGNIVIQVRMVTGREQAFTAHTTLPLRTWICLDIFFQESKVKNPLTPVNTLQKLDRLHRYCDEMSHVTELYLQALRDNSNNSTGVCESYYVDMKKLFGRRECTQTWSWDQQTRFNSTLRLLTDNQRVLAGQPNSNKHLKALSWVIFQDMLKIISKAEDQELMSGVIELLEMSSCWGHHHSSLLLATIHLAGLGIPVDLEQGQVYSLIGGVSDDRLSLMHLGYKHMQGLDGFPKDQNTANGYYTNIGRQTSIDLDQLHDSRQTITEHVHIDNAEELQTQTGESGDVVQFLKYKAERGDVDSQKSLAKILLWGSNGVEKDIRAALMWYARSAHQMADPTAMYDYAILLLKGTGLRKNQTLALELLEKAADMGCAEALNGLGWYYSTIKKDKRRAMRYFELAAQNGSRDGIFNLGIYHLNGENPDNPHKNETAAMQYFLRAAQLGHVEGAVESAVFFSSGTLQGVNRDPEKAVLLLKRVSELNGHLGIMVKEALQIYLRGSWDEALVKYAMLAETGLGVAQHNAAHLCEVLNHSSACQMRYYNYSTHNDIPQESGLLRMGDYYIDMGDMTKAMNMYGVAAVHGSPEGLFNLVMLIEEGHDFPKNILDQMKISVEDRSSHAVVRKLLSRCRELEARNDALTPCSLVLWRVEVRQAWEDFTHSSTQLPLAFGTIAMLTVFVLTTLLKCLLDCYSTLSHSTNQSSEIQRDPPRETQSSQLDSSAHQQHTQQRYVERSRASHISHSLQETADLIVMATGVCVCVIFTMLISHLL